MITQNIIGYQLSSLSGKYVYAADPSSSTTLPEAFATVTIEETHSAVEKAFHAWRIYRNTTGKQKASFLREIANGIESIGDTLIRRIMVETAYPEARVITERNRTCAQLRMFAEIAEKEEWREDIIDEALPNRSPAPRPGLHKRMMAIGPIIVFGASNFPLAYSTAGGDTASALAAGCPVIVKSHESHLGTNALVAEIIMNAAKHHQLPDGVFSSLNGQGIETGKQLVTHPLTAGVGFTGSQKGGRALFDFGQQRPKPIPVFAEMGSVNPIFILPGSIRSNTDSLASMLAGSMTMTVGQFCTNPGIIVALQDENTNNLIQLLIDKLEKVPEATMLNEGIFKSFHKGVASIREEKGIRMVHDPELKNEHMTAPVLATVDAEIFLHHPHLHEEIFGPFSLLVQCSNIDQMMHVAQTIEGQLTATVHASEEDSKEIPGLVHLLVERAGRIIFNGVPTGVEVCESMTHGGPYPASTDSRYTAVGHSSIRRWIRPVTFQNFPSAFISF